MSVAVSAAVLTQNNEDGDVLLLPSNWFHQDNMVIQVYSLARRLYFFQHFNFIQNCTYVQIQCNYGRFIEWENKD